MRRTRVALPHQTTGLGAARIPQRDRREALSLQSTIGALLLHESVHTCTRARAPRARTTQACAWALAHGRVHTPTLSRERGRPTLTQAHALASKHACAQAHAQAWARSAGTRTHAHACACRRVYDARRRARAPLHDPSTARRYATPRDNTPPASASHATLLPERCSTPRALGRERRVSPPRALPPRAIASGCAARAGVCGGGDGAREGRRVAEHDCARDVCGRCRVSPPTVQHTHRGAPTMPHTA